MAKRFEKEEEDARQYRFLSERLFHPSIYFRRPILAGQVLGLLAGHVCEVGHGAEACVWIGRWA